MFDKWTLGKFEFETINTVVDWILEANFSSEHLAICNFKFEGEKN